MKITKIELKDYLNFEQNLVIDLTYPEGHDKAGEPLDKICIIGQSGTGKTSILELIKFLLTDRFKEETKNDLDRNNVYSQNTTIRLLSCRNNKFYKTCEQKNKILWKFDNSSQESSDIREIILSSEQDTSKSILIFFPFSVVRPNNISDIFNDGTVSTNKGAEIGRDDSFKEKQEILNKSSFNVWDFSKYNILNISELILDEIRIYKDELSNKQIDANNKVDVIIKEKSKEEGGEILEKIANIHNELDNWKVKRRNPLEELNDKCLKDVLDNFELELVTNIEKYIDFPNNDEILILKQKNSKKGTDDKIHQKYLSTGTKQIILTAIPLFFIEPKDNIIIFDQPEASLYPNVQEKLHEAYSSIVDDSNQFIYATHSPVFASQFEPWEIVELDFNEEGKVYQKKYYKGECHTDNYNKDLRFLRYDTIYSEHFNTSLNGGPLRERLLTEFSSIEMKLIDLRKKGKKDSEEYKHLKEKFYEKLEKLGGEAYEEN